MTQRRSSVRLLCRAGAATLLAVGAAVLGAPAATAAEADPVVVLDPPDAALFLVPVENYAGLLEPDAASTGADTSLALARAAALAAPELAEALDPGTDAADGADAAGGADPADAAVAVDGAAGALAAEALGGKALGGEGITTSSHSGTGAVDVEHGGTVVVRLPPAVDAADAEVALDVMAADEETEPRHWSDDPAATDRLTVTDLGGNEFSVTLPADDGLFGPDAYLSFDGLTGTDPSVVGVLPLEYHLEFTGDGTGTVVLEPATGLYSSAGCSITAEDPCPAVDVHPGQAVGLEVPGTSVLRTLDLGRLDAAEVGIVRDATEDGEDPEEYSSFQDASLLTRHGAWSATLNLPRDMGTGTWTGLVLVGDPVTTGSFSLTSFGLDVARLNPGLHSNTGWVDEVREASADSTGAVAGVAMLVVAGLITVVAVAPRRRPPSER